VRLWPESLIALTLCVLGACTQPADESNRTDEYKRVVTLAPNLTELVFAAGAGDLLVGVSAYSDFPPAASDLPVVGDAFAIDRETLILLKPDLVLAWEGGTPAHIVDELRGSGLRVEVIRTRTLHDVSSTLRRIGHLTGYVETARAAAENFANGIDRVTKAGSGREDIRVFYQVSARPLYTVSGEHYVSELISRCGGSNVFADLDELAPAVDIESVVARDPEVILASTDAGEDALEVWQRWPNMAANRFGNHFLMPADEIGRATPRLVVAAQAVCEALDSAREKLYERSRSQSTSRPVSSLASVRAMTNNRSESRFR
jgi:iron complex transport system substrate-binding protein